MIWPAGGDDAISLLASVDALSYSTARIQNPALRPITVWSRRTSLSAAPWHRYVGTGWPGGTRVGNRDRARWGWVSLAGRPVPPRCQRLPAGGRQRGHRPGCDPVVQRDRLDRLDPWWVGGRPAGPALSVRSSSSRRPPRVPQAGCPFTRWSLRDLAD